MHRIPRSLGIAVASTALLATAACGGGETTPAADADQLDVVVAFYPLQFVAERVGGPSAKVTNLTQPGAEAHDLELTPRQIASLSEADLVIYQKGFQPAVDAAVDQAKPQNVLDVATIATFLTPGDEAGAGHDHATDTHAHETEDAHGTEDAHDHGNDDPHVWLSTANMAKFATATSEAYAKAKPEDQATFTANANALETDLTAMHDSFQTGLATCKRREFVTSHAAFGYLADEYDLTQIPIRGLTPDNEPSPARVAEVQQLAKEHGITTIFYETLVSPAVAEAVAGDLKLKTDVLDPLEGLTPEAKGSNYLEVMNANLTALKAANECS